MKPIVTEDDWTEEHTARALAAWDEYQRRHDVSDLKGKTAAIDPVSGRVWIGDSGVDVIERMNADHMDVPLYFVRVGYDYYVRKLGKREISTPIRLYHSTDRKS